MVPAFSLFNPKNRVMVMVNSSANNETFVHQLDFRDPPSLRGRDEVQLRVQKSHCYILSLVVTPQLESTVDSASYFRFIGLFENNYFAFVRII